MTHTLQWAGRHGDKVGRESRMNHRGTCPRALSYGKRATSGNKFANQDCKQGPKEGNARRERNTNESAVENRIQIETKERLVATSV